MDHPEEDELQVLRERAYGPAADIHLDSQALQRLYELEGRGRALEAAPAAEVDEKHSEVPPPAAEPAASEGDETDAPPTRRRFTEFRMRRSTFLIVLGLVALTVVSYAALELVQRVQADPLQAGASQVARLSEDGAYEIPAIFSDAGGEAGRGHAYEDFYGLRAVIHDNGMENEDTCILVYSSESITDSADSFTGPAYGGCSAGAFPAAVAFRVTQGLPETLRNTFSDGTALQFVFDERGNEIVVFADE